MPYLPLPVVAGALAPFYRLALHPALPAPVARRIIDAGSVLQALPRDTVVRPLTLAGRPAERITVGATERRTAILYLHGGGYTLGSLDTHRSLAAHLARESGSAVYVLDYRLAPEHPYPAAVEDAVAAYLELLGEHGLTPETLAVAGDSAGGGLSLATARRLVDRYSVKPAALALIAPWVDPGARDAPFDRDTVINTGWSHRAAAAYLGDGDARDPGYAPLLGDLSGLPPTVVHVGMSEVLYPQVVDLVDRMRSAGTTVAYTEHPTLWHVAHLQASLVRESADAVAELGEFLRARLSAQPA
ncbi:alpha/beta hydrolase [Rhodococcus triatomae]|nr:esterase [Rhodococcus triatomae BKS 15-14]